MDAGSSKTPHRKRKPQGKKNRNAGSKTPFDCFAVNKGKIQTPRSTLHQSFRTDPNCSRVPKSLGQPADSNGAATVPVLSVPTPCKNTPVAESVDIGKHTKCVPQMFRIFLFRPPDIFLVWLPASTFYPSKVNGIKKLLTFSQKHDTKERRKSKGTDIVRRDTVGTIVTSQRQRQQFLVRHHRGAQSPC